MPYKDKRILITEDEPSLIFTLRDSPYRKVRSSPSLNSRIGLCRSKKPDSL